MKIILAFSLLIVIAKTNPFEDARVEEQEELFEPEDYDNNEAWFTPNLGRNVSEILPQSTPFLNDQSESSDIPSTMDRGSGLTVLTEDTIIYDSNNFKELAFDKAIIFTVDAKNDAHIGFFLEKKSCAPRCPNEMYEIVIGGWGNSQSVIRRGSQGSNQDLKATPYILKSHEDRPFWADAKDGLVRLGHGKVIGSNIVMKWQDNHPLDPRYVGFMTGFGSTGIWKISENSKDCFEKDTLFVEESFAMNSIQDCFGACRATTCCKFFTWSTTNLNCGLRCYHPNSLINAPTQRTGKRSGITPQPNKVWVGRAISNISSRLQCQGKCKQDYRCQSCTYNESNSPNPNTCVLNFGPTLRKINLPSNSGIASAPKHC